MNRGLILGIAIFFAIVGIALLGGDKTAVAGHCCCKVCHGCHGCYGGCAGCAGCHGCAGCYGGCAGCHGCYGGCAGCAGGCPGAAAGGVEVIEEAPADAPAPEAARRLRRSPIGVRQVSFTR